MSEWDNLEPLVFSERDGEDNGGWYEIVAWDDDTSKKTIPHQRITYKVIDIDGDCNVWLGKSWRIVKEILDDCLINPENSDILSIERQFELWEWGFCEIARRRSYNFVCNAYEEWLFLHPDHERWDCE